MFSPGLIVDRWEKGELLVSTIKVTDACIQPFETAVAHPDYNDGSCIVVATYPNLEEAAAGHAKWVETLQRELPDIILEVPNNVCGAMMMMMAGIDKREHARKEKKVE
jgi:hypothetical protein